MSDIPDIGAARRRKIIERKLAVKRRLAARRSKDVLDLYLESLKEKINSITALTEHKDDEDKE